MAETTVSLYDSFAPCGCLSSFSDQETSFLKEYEHWFLALNRNQSFLGRSLLFLKRHALDEVELNKNEIIEKHRAYVDWHRATKEAFHPDKINQALSGNDEKLHNGHLHWHFVPRYRRPVFFEGQSFFSDSLDTQSLPLGKIDARISAVPETLSSIKVELLKYL